MLLYADHVESFSVWVKMSPVEPDDSFLLTNAIQSPILTLTGPKFWVRTKLFSLFVGFLRNN